MARNPIQVQGRGGALTGGVTQRANYLRPARDNQNSQMLGRAFSTINSAFTAYNRNTQALEARTMADQLADAEQSQREAEAAARSIGEAAGMSGTDLSAQVLQNPAALAEYQEGQILGSMSQGARQIVNDMRQSDLFGDPERVGEFEAMLNENFAAMLTTTGESSTALQARGFLDTQPLRNSLINQNQEAAEVRIKENKETSLSEQLTTALLSGMEEDELYASFEQLIEVDRIGLGNQGVFNAVYGVLARINTLPDDASKMAVVEQFQALIASGEDGKTSRLLAKFNTQQQKTLIDTVERAEAALNSEMSARAIAEQKAADEAIVSQALQDIVAGKPLALLELFPDRPDLVEQLDNLQDTFNTLEREEIFASPDDVIARATSKNYLAQATRQMDAASNKPVTEQLALRNKLVDEGVSKGLLTEVDVFSMATYTAKYTDIASSDAYILSESELDVVISDMTALFEAAKMDFIQQDIDGVKRGQFARQMKAEVYSYFRQNEEAIRAQIAGGESINNIASPAIEYALQRTRSMRLAGTDQTFGGAMRDSLYKVQDQPGAKATFSRLAETFGFGEDVFSPPDLSAAALASFTGSANEFSGQTPQRPAVPEQPSAGISSNEEAVQAAEQRVYEQITEALEAAGFDFSSLPLAVQRRLEREALRFQQGDR